MAAQAAEGRELLPTMQADVDAAQAKYDGAINRVSELQAELEKKHEMLKTLEALGYEEFVETTKQQIKQLHSEIISAKTHVNYCETELREFQYRLRREERRVNDCERAVEKYKADIDRFTAWRDALSTIWKGSKRPMTTPARHTKRQKPRRQGHLRPR